ncbi:MAG: hypothetical protein ACYDA2_05060 [Acidimicrobiales bacterium]
MTAAAGIVGGLVAGTSGGSRLATARSATVALAAASCPQTGDGDPIWQNVEQVGTYSGVAGQFTSIQDAVDAAAPCTVILVAPGDYHELSGRTPPGRPDLPAGVLVTKPDIAIVGMDRNGVVVDGTKAGAPQCSASAGDQDFGPLDGSGHAEGMNGILVWQAQQVWIQNLTVCNYLHGSGNTGNEVWWNGGDGSGRVFQDAGSGFWGDYLTATSTYYGGEDTAAQYGIFSSDWSGGEWTSDYASNFNDSGFYIGACQNVCDQTVTGIWAEYNALGYSGSNSGGRLVVQDSQFDNNEDGFDTNSQNGDNPPPQDGACPAGQIGPVPGFPRYCWVFEHNNVHDNNNPDVPAAGSAAAGPVGTGISLSGARNDLVYDNTFTGNDAWGTILVPYPDQGTPCTGGTPTTFPGEPASLVGQPVCLFDQSGIAVIGNTYADNGGYGNPTNGDIAAVNLAPGAPDCFRKNADTAGPLTTSPPAAQLLYGICTPLPEPPDLNLPFLDEVACDSQVASIGPVSGGAFCLPGTNYPRRTTVVMHALPTSALASMNACTEANIPANSWCP